MGYELITLHFDELFKGAYVKILPPSALSWGALKALDKMAASVPGVDEAAAAQARGETPDLSKIAMPDSMSPMLREMEQVAMECVKEWNIPSIKKWDSDEPIPLPLTDESIDEVPADIVTAVTRATNEARVATRPNRQQRRAGGQRSAKNSGAKRSSKRSSASRKA